MRSFWRSRVNDDPIIQALYEQEDAIIIKDILLDSIQRKVEEGYNKEEIEKVSRFVENIIPPAIR